jgi:nucleoside-diphosphate-sugar epimerase
MRVLVTGSQGYIGAVLVPMLLGRGYDVVGLDSDLYEQCTLACTPMPSIPVMRKDVRDAAVSDLDGFHGVIHLAALSNDPLSDLNPRLTYEINHEASVHLGKLAKKAGVGRFLFSSSCSTYGAAGDEMLTEEASFNPVTPYGHSKVLSERGLSALADDSFSPVFLRNATAYGSSPRIRFDLVLNNLVAWGFATGLVYIKSDGTPWRPVVHVEDIARAFVAALEAPIESIHNRAFNVGTNEENYQVRNLAEIVKETVPGCRIEFAPGAGPDKRNYRVDFGRISRALPGFRPAWNVRKGAAEVLEACQRAHLTVDDFEGPRFKRIEHIRRLLGSGKLGQDLRWRDESPQPECQSEWEDRREHVLPGGAGA